MLALLFFFWWRFSKNFVFLWFINKKPDKPKWLSVSKNKTLTEEQYQYTYIIPRPIYFITIPSHFASTIIPGQYQNLFFQVFTEIGIAMVVSWILLVSMRIFVKLWTMVTFTLVFIKNLKFFAIGTDYIWLLTGKPKRSIKKIVENKK